MSLREGTRRRRISVLHMLGTWEGKIDGCNCPSCKECSGKGTSEAAALTNSPGKMTKGPKIAVRKITVKSKLINQSREELLRKSSAENVRVKAVTSNSSSDGKKQNLVNSNKFVGAVSKNSEDGGIDWDEEDASILMEEDAEVSKNMMEEALKSTSKNIPKKIFKMSQDNTDQSTGVKRKGVSNDDEILADPIRIKQEPDEYLSDSINANKAGRGRQSGRGRGEMRSNKRARMVTSEMENTYAKPRMIFTGRGVVRKFEPGVDRKPKSKRGRKPGKALAPINIKQEPKELKEPKESKEPKELVIVKQEVEPHDLDELQKALTEAAENIGDVGDELFDAFNEYGPQTAKKVKPQKKKTAPIFKRLESEGDKYVECNICFKVLKEMSMKQHYKTHTGEKPHTCEICQSRFTRKGDVERHKRLVHKNQRPFRCQKCLKEFSDRKNLKAHLQNHDKAIYYDCSTCGFKFGKREYYENHIRYIHPLPEGTEPAFSTEEDDLAAKQLKQIEMEERKERIAHKSAINLRNELLMDDLEDGDDEDDMDEEDRAIEITVAEMDEGKLFELDPLMIKKENQDDSMDDASMNIQLEEEDEDEDDLDDELEESNTVMATPQDQKSKPGTSSPIMQLFKNNPSPPPPEGGTNVKVSKGMLSLTQTISVNDSQGDEDLVDKVIADAVSQATDMIQSLQAKSSGNMSRNGMEFGEEEEEETEEEEREDAPEELEDILGDSNYKVLPIAAMPPKPSSPQPQPQPQPTEIHITATISGQPRKFIIQVPPGTNINVQSQEGMEMIVNIVNQLCVGKELELNGPIEVVMNKAPSNQVMMVTNKR